jgi:uncharacterized protein YciI
MAEKQHFVGMIRPIRAGFVDDPTPDEERMMGVHFQYLKDAMADGKLLMAGPCIAGADTFGLIVLRMESEDEAQAFLDADPSVVGGVQTARLFPFHLALWAGK